PEPAASCAEGGERVAVRGGDEDASVRDGGRPVDAAVHGRAPADASGARREREQAPAVVADEERAARERGARGDLVAAVVDPAEAAPPQVERVDVPVPGAEVVDAIAHDRGRLDRRADREVPQEPA